MPLYYLSISVTFTNVYILCIGRERAKFKGVYLSVFYYTLDGIPYATQALSGIKTPMKTKLFWWGVGVMIFLVSLFFSPSRPLNRILGLKMWRPLDHTGSDIPFSPTGLWFCIHFQWSSLSHQHSQLYPKGGWAGHAESYSTGFWCVAEGDPSDFWRGAIPWDQKWSEGGRHHDLLCFWFPRWQLPIWWGRGLPRPCLLSWPRDWRRHSLRFRWALDTRKCQPWW